MKLKRNTLYMRAYRKRPAVVQRMRERAADLVADRAGRSSEQVAEYEARLTAVAGLLSSQPMTAKDVAAALGRKSMKAVYEWLRVLEERGFKVRKKKKSFGGVGPRVIVFEIVA